MQLTFVWFIIHIHNRNKCQFQNSGVKKDTPCLNQVHNSYTELSFLRVYRRALAKVFCSKDKEQGQFCVSAGKPPTRNGGTRMSQSEARCSTSHPIPC